MIALLLAVLGFILIITPAILAFLDDVRDEDDIIEWLMSYSFDNIVLMRAMMLSGCGLIWAGAAVYYLP